MAALLFDTELELLEAREVELARALLRGAEPLAALKRAREKERRMQGRPSKPREKQVRDVIVPEAITVGEVADAINSNSAFQGEIDNQVLSTPIIDAPLAKGAIDFVNMLKVKEGQDENN